MEPNCGESLRVKTSATAEAKISAFNDIKAALYIGWTVETVIYQVFGNLAKITLTDPTKHALLDAKFYRSLTGHEFLESHRLWTS